ncbi:hypothetical protein EFB08_05680 [Rufibacter latericius]|uniref:Uncharacterized protein n=1 Tax=Rufibacter latericius TaxID=2487040 RepID=A0A3M9MYX1_9BACT|nr:hypothetical protein EFB08_05680 [Rufibacter latericius]
MASGGTWWCCWRPVCLSAILGFPKPQQQLREVTTLPSPAHQYHVLTEPKPRGVGELHQMEVIMELIYIRIFATLSLMG